MTLTKDQIDCKWAMLVCGAQLALITNPIEISKVRLQLQGETPKHFSIRNSKGTIGGRISDIWRLEGANKLIRGSTPSALHCGFTHFLAAQALQFVDIFGVKKPMKGSLFTFKSSLQLASIIGLPAAIIPSPLYLVKIRMQSKMDVRPYKIGYQHAILNRSIISLLRDVYNNDNGMRALYRAALSSYIKFTAITSVSIYTYMQTQQLIEETKICNDKWKPLLSAAIGGTVGAFVASPLDLISTRLYNQGVSRYGGNMQYKRYRDCLFKVFRKEGLSGYFRGSLPMTIVFAFQSTLALYLWDSYNILYNM